MRQGYAAFATGDLAKVQEIMGSLRLQLHPTKTRLVELGLGKDGFTFLGCYLRIVRSHFKGKCYLYRWPSPKATKRDSGSMGRPGASSPIRLVPAGAETACLHGYAMREGLRRPKRRAIPQIMPLSTPSACPTSWMCFCLESINASPSLKIS